MSEPERKQLDLEDLRSFARLAGPCVTLQVPESRPGAAEAPRRTQLRQLTHAAVEALGNFSPKAKADNVANALKTFVETIDMGNGPGYTVFVAPGHETVLLTPRVEASATAAGHFNLLPLLAAASAPSHFYALGVSRKSIRLWHITPAGCEEVALPHTVPASIQAENIDQSTHNLQNRSTVAAGGGSVRSMRFGTVSDYDSEAEHLHHFFGTVAKGLHDVVKDSPIFLIGTQPDTLAFRRAAHGANFLEAEWHDSPAYCSAAHVEAEARAAAAAESYRKAERAILPLPEIREKIEGNPAAVYKAATEGRVHQLFVAENARMTASEAHASNLQANEDILNAAAVEALRTGGTVYVLPGAALPSGQAIAAVLRY